MAFERLSGVIVQLVWAAVDEDGNTVGERVDAPVKVYHPHGASLDDYLRQREDELMRAQREAAARSPEVPIGAGMREPFGGNRRLD
jgi:hypothetical protein